MCIAAMSMTNAATAAVVLYDNLYNESNYGGVIASGLEPFATSFSTPDVELPLSQVTLSLFGSFYHDGGTRTDVVLYEDNGTTPGQILLTIGSIRNDELPYYRVENIDFTLDVPFDLTPNTRYWIGLVGRTAANWSIGVDASGVGVQGEYLNFGFGTSPNTGAPLQMRVTAIPEPGSMLLLGFGMCAAVSARRGRRI